MKVYYKFLLFWMLVFFMASSCRKDDNFDNEPISQVNKGIYDLMKNVYLWYDELPELNPSLYSSPDALMEALRYTVYDKWSTVLTKTEYDQYFEKGQMIGHGFMLGADKTSKIRVAFIYRSTQAYNLGVRRGWILSRINGVAVTPENAFQLLGPSETGRSNTISFINAVGENIELALTKEVVSITPVVHYEVLHQGDTRIGYMVFQDFIDPAKAELDEAFNSFNAEGIDELVIDLRYNGGGSVDVAEYMAGWLFGKNYSNQPFVSFRHNLHLADWDTTLMIPANVNGLALNRVFFIGTRSTASASELVINGAKPYASSMILAGSTTHGKPVGMYAFPLLHYNYVVLPVTFKCTNANDEGDFYNGIAPDIQAEDDVTRDFGDAEEASLKSVLNYITSGTIPVATKSTAGSVRLIERDKGAGQFLKAY